MATLCLTQNFLCGLSPRQHSSRYFLLAISRIKLFVAVFLFAISGTELFVAVFLLAISGIEEFSLAALRSHRCPAADGQGACFHTL